MKKLIIALSVCLVAVAVVCAFFAVPGQKHTHNYTAIGKDGANHWHYCPDDGEIDPASVEAHEDFDTNFVCDTCGQFVL